MHILTVRVNIYTFAECFVVSSENHTHNFGIPLDKYFCMHIHSKITVNIEYLINIMTYNYKEAQMMNVCMETSIIM
jgi:hypothetical protein